jgi:hypothetical protein
MADIERPIASFSEEKKSDTPLPVEAAPNSDYEASFDEFAGAWANGEAVFLAERFGAKVAANERFAEETWVNAEKHMRAEWGKRTQAPWNEVAPAIQKGWTRVRGED